MDNLVIKSHGKDVTTSLIVAEVFNKRHDNVLKDIKSLSCSPEFNLLNFEEIEYTDDRGRKQRAYEITKDGFSFLVMGYNGEKASAFKEKFIAEFNKHEAMLKSEDYILGQAMEILNQRKAYLENLVQNQEQKILLQENELKKSAPLVTYATEVLNSEATIVTNVIANELGMSAISLNRKLKDLKVIYRQGESYVLYQQYRDKGLAKTKTYPYTDSKGEQKTAIQLVWTEKGRRFVHDIMDKVKELSRNEMKH